MGPELEREAYGPAVLKGVQTLAGEIARGYGVSDSALTAYRAPVEPSARGRTIGNLLPILLFILFIVISSRGAGGRRRRRQIYWAAAGSVEVEADLVASVEVVASAVVVPGDDSDARFGGSSG
jgi:hypothetical protein